MPPTPATQEDLDLLKQQVIKVATHVLNFIPKLEKVESASTKISEDLQSLSQLVTTSVKELNAKIDALPVPSTETGKDDHKDILAALESKFAALEKQVKDNTEDVRSQLGFLDKKLASIPAPSGKADEQQAKLETKIQELSGEIEDIRFEINPPHVPYITFKGTGEFAAIVYPKGFHTFSCKDPKNFSTVTYNISSEDEAFAHYREILEVRGIEEDDSTKPELFKWFDSGYFYILTNAEYGKELVVRGEHLPTMAEVWKAIALKTERFKDCKEFRPIFITSAQAPLQGLDNTLRKTAI